MRLEMLTLMIFAHIFYGCDHKDISSNSYFYVQENESFEVKIRKLEVGLEDSNLYDVQAGTNLLKIYEGNQPKTENGYPEKLHQNSSYERVDIEKTGFLWSYRSKVDNSYVMRTKCDDFPQYLHLYSSKNPVDPTSLNQVFKQIEARKPDEAC